MYEVKSSDWFEYVTTPRVNGSVTRLWSGSIGYPYGMGLFRLPSHTGVLWMAILIGNSPGAIAITILPMNSTGKAGPAVSIVSQPETKWLVLPVVDSSVYKAESLIFIQSRQNVFADVYQTWLGSETEMLVKAGVRVYGAVTTSEPSIISAMAIAQKLLGLRDIVLTNDQLKAADVDGDGEVTFEDAYLIADYLAKIPSGRVGKAVNASDPVPRLNPLGKSRLRVDFGYTIVGSEVQFTNRSIGQIKKYEWDFGDGGTSVLSNPKHTYSSAGKFQVSLTVTDHLLSLKTTKEVEIGVLPTTPPGGGFSWWWIVLPVGALLLFQKKFRRLK